MVSTFIGNSFWCHDARVTEKTRRVVFHHVRPSLSPTTMSADDPESRGTISRVSIDARQHWIDIQDPVRQSAIEALKNQLAAVVMESVLARIRSDGISPVTTQAHGPKEDAKILVSFES